MSCQHCKYFNDNERWGSKGYCEYYKTYYYGTDRECSHFTKRDGGGCFLTSACCEFKGLSDDCYELTMFRKFRDDYLKTAESRAWLVDEYYRIAPDIVDKINASESKEKTYDYIYSVIEKCVPMIANGENEDALKEYQNMVSELKSEFLEEV